MEPNFIDFPLPSGGFVYIFYWTAADGKEIPFYVGQADCFQTRMVDYHRKQFSCPTDFNVGEAAEYLNCLKNQVRVKYWPSEDRHQEEYDNIQRLSKTFKLLNNKFGYDYRASSREERSRKIEQQRALVRKFCDDLITLSK